MPCYPSGYLTGPCASPNTTGFGDLFSYVNSTTGNDFGLGLLALVFFVSFVGMSSFPPRQNIPTSLFITMVSAVLLHAANAVDVNTVMLLIIATAAATVLFSLQRSDF